MSTLRLIAIGILAFMLSGCGQLVSEKLSMSGNTASERCTSKKIVILPFADYSYTDDAERAFSRNINIMENLIGNLTGKGFRLPVQEDLLKYLTDTNIATLGSDSGMPGYIGHAITNDASWSDEMRAELTKIAKEERSLSSSDQTNNYALDGKTLAKIADHFSADLVMRGQLLKYEFGQENTWSPLKKGIMPVLFAGTNRALFGVTNSS